jgi:single-strand DNA-binding protein
MLNQCTLTGRLVAEPELRSTVKDGISATSARIAVSRDYVKEGETDTDFFDVVAWRATAEFICKYFGKGSMITVTGRLRNRRWEDKQGQKRTATELVAERVYFADSKKKDDGENRAPALPYGGAAPQYTGASPFDDDDGDELPF